MARFRPIGVGALLLVVVLSLGCGGPTGAGGRGALASSDAGTPPELQRINTLLADLAARLKPGLVQVAGRRRAGGETRREEEDEPRRATGSGFVIDGSGLIVTNAHVVESAEKVQVRLSDGRRYTGTLVGRDNRVDLALIRIDGATNLTVLPLGDSNRLRVGEFVLALGHPFGLEQSVSFGIVSRKGAPLTIAAPGFDFIQTDAAINPGNSGGPPANMAGEGGGVDGTALEGPRDLQRVVSTTPVGKKVRVTLLRDGRETEVEVTVGLYEEREARRLERPRQPARPDAPTPPKE